MAKCRVNWLFLHDNRMFKPGDEVDLSGDALIDLRGSSVVTVLASSEDPVEGDPDPDNLAGLTEDPVDKPEIETPKVEAEKPKRNRRSNNSK